MRQNVNKGNYYEKTSLHSALKSGNKKFNEMFNGT